MYICAHLSYEEEIKCLTLHHFSYFYLLCCFSCSLWKRHLLQYWIVVYLSSICLLEIRKEQHHYHTHTHPCPYLNHQPRMTSVHIIKSLSRYSQHCFIEAILCFNHRYLKEPPYRSSTWSVWVFVCWEDQLLPQCHTFHPWYYTTVASTHATQPQVSVRWLHFQQIWCIQQRSC